MKRSLIKASIIVGAMLIAFHAGVHGSQQAKAQGYLQPAPRYDLFANYYVNSSVGGPPAQLYLSPRPTPPLVGHTYITYEPVMPHEFLHRHAKRYYRYEVVPGVFGARAVPRNCTRVIWW